MTTKKIKFNTLRSELTKVGQALPDVKKEFSILSNKKALLSEGF